MGFHLVETIRLVREAGRLFNKKNPTLEYELGVAEAALTSVVKTSTATTASLGKIKLKEKEILPNIVQTLLYRYRFDGFFFFLGYDNIINIWSPECNATQVGSLLLWAGVSLTKTGPSYQKL